VNDPRFSLTLRWSSYTVTDIGGFWANTPFMIKKFFFDGSRLYASFAVSEKTRAESALHAPISLELFFLRGSRVHGTVTVDDESYIDTCATFGYLHRPGFGGACVNAAFSSQLHQVFTT
jgi:hypothetical protein